MKLFLPFASLLFFQAQQIAAAAEVDNDAAVAGGRGHLRASAGPTDHRVLCDLGLPDSYRETCAARNMTCETRVNCCGIASEHHECQCLQDDSKGCVFKDESNKRAGCQSPCEDNPCDANAMCLVGIDMNGNGVGFCAIDISVQVIVCMRATRSKHKHWKHCTVEAEGTTVGDVEQLIKDDIMLTGLRDINWSHNGRNIDRRDESDSDFGIDSSGETLKLNAKLQEAVPSSGNIGQQKLTIAAHVFKSTRGSPQISCRRVWIQ